MEGRLWVSDDKASLLVSDDKASLLEIETGRDASD